MSTVKKSHVVYGYFRNNYEHNVPDAIIKMCLMYFDVVFQHRYNKKIFQHLLSAPVGRAKLKLVIFNQHLSFRVGVATNCVNEHHGEFAALILKVASGLAKCIDSIRICVQFDVLEVQSTLIGLGSFTAGNEDFLYLAMDKSNIHKLEKLTFKFIIHSIIIKYKKDKETLYYPSMESMKLKEKIRFAWNVDKTLIESFKNYKRFGFSSPIFDNVSIKCYPNGVNSYTQGRFCWGLLVASFPVNIEKMDIAITAKTNFCEIKREYTASLNFLESSIVCCIDNEFALNELNDELVFEVEVIVMELYDFDDHLIPKDQWSEHNVCIS